MSLACIPLLDGTSDDTIHSQAHDFDKIWLGADCPHDGLIATLVDEGNKGEGIGHEQNPFTGQMAPDGDARKTHAEGGATFGFCDE